MKTTKRNIVIIPHINIKYVQCSYLDTRLNMYYFSFTWIHNVAGGKEIGFSRRFFDYHYVLLFIEESTYPRNPEFSREPNLNLLSDSLWE